MVGHIGSVGLARSVQDEALGPLGTVGDPGAVVVAEAFAAHCVEAADDLGMHQQAAEGFAVGMGQFEQVGEGLLAGALERIRPALGAAVVGALLHPVHAVIDSGVACAQFLGGEDVADDQIAGQVPEIAFACIHVNSPQSRFFGRRISAGANPCGGRLARRGRLVVRA